MSATPAPPAALAERLRGRVTFVAGKGGVGKTTLAGALAVAFADAGRRTHLVSTDPAHSVGDLFGEDLAAGSERSCGCAPGLVLEEFDADRFGRDWLADASASVAELVERGTYLDAEDLSGFLELALPGIDEVMAALRLAELTAGAAERVVVDTAPTGHLLRLLDAGDLIDGWTAALDAMAEKARVVAGRLAGRSVRFAAESVIDELGGSAARFRDDVLGAADFVVAYTPESVVRSETERLAADVARRGLRVAVRVRTGGPPAAADAWRVPRRPGVQGCDALRTLLADATPPAGALSAGAEAAAAGTGAGPERIAPGAGPVPAERLADGSPAVRERHAAGEPVDGWLRELPELVLVAGKGGVGKSTCAAAIALGLTEGRGGEPPRSVVLFSTDPAGSLADVFGRTAGGEAFEPVPGLEARRLSTRVAFEGFRERYREDVDRIFAGMGLDRAAALDRRVVESLWNFAPPGIDELVALAGILEVRAERDTLIVDAAPTGHFLRLLRMPELALEWTHALMRVLLKYQAVAGLEGTAERLLRLARRLRELNGALRDADTAAAIVVTLDEPLVRAETARLAAALDRAEIALDAAIHNRVAGADGHAAGPGPGVRAAGEGVSAEPEAARDAAPRAILRIRAPERPAPVEGADALRTFIDGWELIS